LRINYFSLGGLRKGFTGLETIEMGLKGDNEMGLRYGMEGRGRNQFKVMVTGNFEKKGWFRL
jgi:hypothetical protein